jgi:hypothetical protein
MDGSLQSESEERRCGDRRTNRLHVFRDKRTGFDRRACTEERGVRDVVRGALLALRDSPRTLVVLLLVVNALNLVDFGLTLNALARGADEANPVMATLFDAGPIWAGIFKVAAVALASLLVWEWKRYRKALAAAVMMLALFAAVFVYHIVGLLTLYG